MDFSYSLPGHVTYDTGQNDHQPGPRPHPMTSPATRPRRCRSGPNGPRLRLGAARDERPPDRRRERRGGRKRTVILARENRTASVLSFCRFLLGPLFLGFPPPQKPIRFGMALAVFVLGPLFFLFLWGRVGKRKPSWIVPPNLPGEFDILLGQIAAS